MGLRRVGAVTLSPASYDALFAALDDAFTDNGELSRLARSLGARLGQLTAADDTTRDICRKLIEAAEARDQVADLVAAAKQVNPTNALVAALDPARFTEAGPVHLAEAAGGSDGFKAGVGQAIRDVSTPGLEAVGAAALAALAATTGPDETGTLLATLVSLLRGDPPDAVTESLVPVVATTLRRLVAGGGHPVVNLARSRLRRVVLADLSLVRADLAFCDLRHADLTNVNLWRARGYGADLGKARLSRSNLEEARLHTADATGAQFHDCRMVSVFLKDADLTGAQFQRARLQGAHFERATLTGARFEDALVADASFYGAVLDDAAVASLARAEGWQHAKLDPAARERLARA